MKGEASEAGRAAVEAGGWVVCALSSCIGPDGETEWIWHASRPVTDEELEEAKRAIDVLVEDFRAEAA